MLMMLHIQDVIFLGVIKKDGRPRTLSHDLLDICGGDVYSHEAVISNPKCDHHVYSLLPSPVN